MLARVDRLTDAKLGWLTAALVLHVCGQACRGLAWRGVLRAVWPDVQRRRVCAWHMCGAGLTGVLSVRGGDAVRMALAKRELPRATWAALAGSLAVEGSFEVVCGLVLTFVAAWLGISSLGAPSPVVVAGALVATAAIAVLAGRSARVRSVVCEVKGGFAVLGDRRRWLLDVLPYQVAARALRFCAVACFLLAFGLPATPVVIVAACAAQGSGALLPLPGAGPATWAAALLVTLPIAAGHPIDEGSVRALAVVQPLMLTLVGVATSVAMLALVSGAYTPRALARAAWALRPQPAAAAP
jgi:Lysylphosphatidylglycerol synthase TM region